MESGCVTWLPEDHGIDNTKCQRAITGYYCRTCLTHGFLSCRLWMKTSVWKWTWIPFNPAVGCALSLSVRRRGQTETWQSRCLCWLCPLRRNVWIRESDTAPSVLIGEFWKVASRWWWRRALGSCLTAVDKVALTVWHTEVIQSLQRCESPLGASLSSASYSANHFSGYLSHVS